MAWSRPDGVRGGHLDLAAELKRLDGKGYKAYKDLGGGWELPLETSTAKISCILFMDHVQGDPYAAPSRMRLRISRKDSAIPTETTENRARRVALEDYLTRVADRMAGRSGVGVTLHMVHEQNAGDLRSRCLKGQLPPPTKILVCFIALAI